jgi:hypothetical protein
MLSKKEVALISVRYFLIIRQTEDYIELMSKNTMHCWILKKCVSKSKYPYLLYHKHQSDIPYYHKHRYTYTILESIKSIKSHDYYVINGYKEYCSSFTI